MALTDYSSETRYVWHRADTDGIVLTEYVIVSYQGTPVEAHAFWRDWRTGTLARITNVPLETAYTATEVAR